MSLDVTLKSPVVSVAWLHENLTAKNLIVLDATINKVFDNVLDQISDSRFFDIKKKFSDLLNPFPSAFPSVEQFQKEARALGINNASAIVVYDDKGIYSSARVWWMFKAFGHHNIAVLDGGFPAWNKAGFSTEKMKIYKGESGDFIAQPQLGFMKFFNDVKDASESKSHNIIDARSAGRFNGTVQEPREGLRMGTIPNSVNLPFTDLLKDGVLKSKKELAKAFYMVADINDDIIFSCGSGLTACVLALGAEISGYKNISVYDGSWTEWGSLVEN